MAAPHDLLNPAHYAAVRRKPMDAEILPGWCYTSKEWFEMEMERVIRPSWGFVGHTNRVPKPGDYVAFNYAGHPVIIVRGRDMAVRAFANTCRHRGVELIPEGEGQLRAAIKCPYHGWIYGLDGTLTGAAGMEKARGFEKKNYGLVPIRLEQWGQFMFLNPSGTAPALKAWFGRLWDESGAYGPDDLVVTRRMAYDQACNWKIPVENFNDEGHIRTVHQKSLLDTTEKYQVAAFYECGPGRWVTSYCKHDGTRSLIGGVDGPQGFAPVPSLAGRYLHGSYHPTIFPHNCFGLCIDGGWALEILPIAPDRTRVVVNVFFHKAALDRPDFEEVAGRYYHRFKVSTDEDADVQQALQRGYASPDYRPGRLGFEEVGINWLHNWWLDRMFGLPEKESEIDERAA